MKMERLGYLLLTVAIGFAAVLLFVGLMDVSSANAQGNASVLPVQRQKYDFGFEILATVVFTDPASVEITDLAGEILGEGQHVGELVCHGDNCNKKTQLSFEGTEYEYKYSTRLAIDPEARRVVVAGIGTISNSEKKKRFSFTAIFEDNRDGTVNVIYQASRPDASFIIPRAPGGFDIRSRP